MVFEASSGMLQCEYCKHSVAAGTDRAAEAPGPRELSLHDGMSRAPRGLGVEMQAVQCRSCGANVQVAPNERTVACTYCASTMVMVAPADANSIQPESLVPFHIARPQATASFQTWLATRWFRPSDLARMAKLEQIVGVYVPFWTFDADVQSQWTAERGHHYYVTETYQTVENGQSVTRTREVQHTRWEPASGFRADHYDDALVCASRGLPETLAGKLCTFDTTRLVAYAPSYLAGWRAESYAIDLPTAWTRARGRIEQTQAQRCSGDVGGDVHRSLSVANEFSGETFKHVLLPVWVAAYRYGDKPYRFLVNGQSGDVVGDAPLSVWKITLLVLVILAVIAVGFVLFNGANAEAPPAASLDRARSRPSEPRLVERTVDSRRQFDRFHVDFVRARAPKTVLVTSRGREGTTRGYSSWGQSHRPKRG